MSEVAYTVTVGNTKKDGIVQRPLKITNKVNKVRSIGTSSSEEAVEALVKGKGAIETIHYKIEGDYPNTITYTIYVKHPNMFEFDELYETAQPGYTDSGAPSTFTPGGGGSRRRRPSRKYKKSKRVLRRKSRSTRRR